MVNNDNNPGDMELESMTAHYGSLDHEDMELELESMMDYNGVFDKQKYNELESMMTRAEDAIKKMDILYKENNYNLDNHINDIYENVLTMKLDINRTLSRLDLPKDVHAEIQKRLTIINEDIKNWNGIIVLATNQILLGVEFEKIRVSFFDKFVSNSTPSIWEVT